MWEQFFTSNYPFGHTQYAKFASLMIDRIRAGVSDFDEVRRFYDLIVSGSDLWNPAIAIIPEWEINP